MSNPGRNPAPPAGPRTLGLRAPGPRTWGMGG